MDDIRSLGAGRGSKERKTPIRTGQSEQLLRTVLGLIKECFPLATFPES